MAHDMIIFDIHLYNRYYFYHLPLIHSYILFFSIIFIFMLIFFHFNPFSQLIKLFNLQIIDSNNKWNQ